MEDLFPSRDDIDYNELKITEEGVYSITRKKDAERILFYIKTVLGDTDTKIMTDATGCVGGDTLNFACVFKHVFTIELKKDNYDALRQNVRTYGFKNVTVYNNDSTKFYNWATDVLYIDPPWGGPAYKEFEKLDLYMSKTRLDDWLEEILLRENRPNYIFLKLPQNYNFSRLTFLPNIHSTKQFQIRKFILLSITVNLGRNRPDPSYT
jgi:hypothetical protein